MKKPYIYGRTGEKHDHPMTCSDCGKTIRPGAWVMWDEPSYEYGETDPFCMSCTKLSEKVMQETDWDEMARQAGLK